MDPVVVGVVVKLGEVGEKVADSAAKETGGLLTRLLGPSADVIGQDWAERLRQTNMARLLKKTEKLAAGKGDPGWAQPRVANAVFEAAQYANDEIVTDYLSGVLASSREPDGGTDDALPWSSLVSRLSALGSPAPDPLCLLLKPAPDRQSDRGASAVVSFRFAAGVVADEGVSSRDRPRCGRYRLPAFR